MPSRLHLSITARVYHHPRSWLLKIYIIIKTEIYGDRESLQTNCELDIWQTFVYFELYYSPHVTWVRAAAVFDLNDVTQSSILQMAGNPPPRLNIVTHGVYWRYMLCLWIVLLWVTGDGLLTTAHGVSRGLQIWALTWCYVCVWGGEILGCVCVLLASVCLSLFVWNIEFFVFSLLLRRKYMMDK